MSTPATAGTPTTVVVMRNHLTQRIASPAPENTQPRIARMTRINPMELFLSVSSVKSVVEFGFLLLLPHVEPHLDHLVPAAAGESAIRPERERQHLAGVLH